MKRFVTCTTLFVALGLWSATCAVGQVVPYKTTGVGVYQPVNGNYGGSGTGTHVGNHTFVGNVLTSPTSHPLVFDFEILTSNPQVTIAANGDRVFYSGSGQVQLIPLEPTFTFFSAVWSGTFVVEGGTGRFATMAPGPQPLNVVAINQPFTFADPQWAFTWQLNGFVQLR